MNENKNNDNNLNQSNIDQIPVQQEPSQINIQYQNNNQTNGEQATNYATQNNSTNKDSKVFVSIVLGSVSMLLALYIAIFALPIAIVGLIFGISSKSKGKEKVAAIIVNAISIVLSLLVTFFVILIFIIGSDILSSSNDYINNSHIYYGDGYNLPYDGKWREVYEKDNYSTKRLTYGDEELYFSPVGKSSLSELESELSCDAETSSCREIIYSKFYEYWDNNSDQNHLYGGSNNFDILKDDIYYATMNYGTSDTSIDGKMYLLISKDNNIILSFISKTSNSNEDDNIILDLLKNISVYEYYDGNTDNNELESGDTLGELNNWNMYADLRKENISHNKTINGGWRILNDSEVYWVFKNNEFWWYKSVNDLNDNYWYGTTEIITGKDGFKKAGLSEDKIDTIIKQSNGNVTEDDVYTIVCTPKQMISAGQDQSSINIPADVAWTYIWVVVDHGMEGIEAQVLNMQEYENSYYVKIND